MNAQLCPIRDLSDDDLLARIRALVASERRDAAEIVAHLGEVEARNLHLGRGYASLNVYCRQVLLYSEAAAYKRVYAARAARQFPQILEHLASGALSLSVVAVLGPKLTEDNAAELLAAARFASRRDVERLLAERFGAKRRRDRIEPLIGDGPGPQLPLGLSPGTVRDSSNCPDAPTAAPTASYEIRFTADQALVDKLEAAKDLLRHQIPDGNLAEVFDRVLTTFIAAATKRKAAVTDRPRQPKQAEPAPEAPASDDIPAEVRRQVWERDGAQCAFVGLDGHRCTERGCLEFHHVIPKAAGGPATISNISVRCRGHNYYEAVRDFGRDKVDRARREGRPRASAPSGPPTTRVELVESALRNLEFSAADARRAVAQARTLVPETDSTDKAALEALLRASLRVLAPPRRTVEP